MTGEGLERTEREIAGEKAAALGRSGRRLRSALDKLRKFDSVAGQPRGRTGRRSAATAGHAAAREELLALAAEAYWSYIVQREALGLYENDSVIADYGVPPEVQRRMGPRPPRSG